MKFGSRGRDNRLCTHAAVAAQFKFSTPVALGVSSQSKALKIKADGPLEPWFDKTWRPGEIEFQQ